MSNEIEVLSGYRYLFRDGTEGYFDGKVIEFAVQCRYVAQVGNMFKFAKLDIGNNKTRWVELDKVEVIECLDKEGKC